MSMHAAVVRSFGQPPRYETYETPEPGGPDEALVDVLAAGLHPRVRTGAAEVDTAGRLSRRLGMRGKGRSRGRTARVTAHQEPQPENRQDNHGHE